MKLNQGTLQELRQKGTYAYDPSSIGSFISCPQMYYYRYELGLLRKDAEPSYSLEFGGSGHKGLEVWEKTERDDTAGIQAAIKSFTGHEEPPKIGKSGKELAPTYSMIYLCSVLNAYFQKYRADKRRVIETELAVGEELIPGIYLIGRIDKIMEDSRGVVFADYKFTKYPDKYWTLPSLQFTTYAFITSKLTGKQVRGELDLVGISKTKSPDELLTRVPFEYNDFQLETWKNSAIYWTQQINTCRLANYWPQSWQCQPFFRDCAYAPLCQAVDRNLIEPLIQSMYRVDFWDPFQES